MFMWYVIHSPKNQEPKPAESQLEEDPYLQFLKDFGDMKEEMDKPAESYVVVLTCSQDEKTELP